MVNCCCCCYYCGGGGVIVGSRVSTEGLQGEEEVVAVLVQNMLALFPPGVSIHSGLAHILASAGDCGMGVAGHLSLLCNMA